MKQKTIAISACLLGHKVRYDGKHQANEMIIQRFIDCFNIIPVCPEVEIGLGVPREKITLHQRGTKIHLLTCSLPVIDLTERMAAYARTFMKSHSVVSGMILKDKSPSCGVANCKQYEKMGRMQRNGTGIFAATIMQLNPDLPMLQSDLASHPIELENFVKKVELYEY